MATITWEGKRNATHSSPFLKVKEERKERRGKSLTDRGVAKEDVS